MTELLEVQGLTKRYRHRGRRSSQAGGVLAADDVSFRVGAGETVALVGESGSGKTTVARLVVGALAPTSGRTILEGEEVRFAEGGVPLEKRRQIQMIFQDPTASLNPRLPIADAIEEGIRLHGLRKGSKAISQRIEEIMDLVGLSASFRRRLPHELSGGQRQRVAIARVLGVEPKVLVCDEAVSALDVSVQAQVLNVLKDLQDETGVSYLFISHDLGVVRHVADRTLVMYRGRIVESGPTATLLDAPVHPYTQLLLDSVPVPDPTYKRGRRVPRGTVTETGTPDHGCRYYPRCPLRQPSCLEGQPPLAAADGDDHQVACPIQLSTAMAVNTRPE